MESVTSVTLDSNFSWYLKYRKTHKHIEKREYEEIYL